MDSTTELKDYQSVIRDKNIWLYIFGKENPDVNNAQSYYRYINNTVNLAFIYAFACIKDMYNTVEDIETLKETFNPNAKRAIKNIDRIFCGLDVSYELINYILLDIQFDLALGADSCLKQYIPGITTDFNVLMYSPRILHWMNSSKPEIGISIDDLTELFRSLVSTLPFLMNTALLGERGDTYFMTKSGFTKKTAYTDYKLYIQDCGRGFYQFYFLERIEFKKNMLLLDYSTPDYADKFFVVFHTKSVEAEERDNYEYIISDNDEIESIRNRIQGNEAFDEIADGNSIDGISNIYTVNYKYLKNLSLSISDELGRSDNTLCRDKLLLKYGVRPEDKYDLDGFLIMQLIERSPSTVLFDLFCLDNSAVHSVVRNLYNRFNCKITFNHVDFSRNPVDFSVLDRYFAKKLRNAHSVHYDMDLAELQANYVLSMLLANSRESEARITRVSDVIETVDENRGVEVAQEACASLLVKTLCFYQGVVAYGQAKMEYDAEYYDSMPSGEKIRESQERFHQRFMWAAEETYKSEFLTTGTSPDKREQLRQAIEKFVAFNNHLDSNIGMRRALKCVLGREYIVDSRKLGLSTSILAMDDDSQRKQILGILEFLTTGSFEKNEAQGDYNSSIYPIMGKYVSNVESNDQCRIANFSIRIDVDANGKTDYMKKINILSEFYYQIDEYYYCLPNVARSNQEWWIDPVIINAKEFDSIFVGKE